MKEDPNEIIKAALENGINFFDTAMSYQGGTSEMFVGRALRNFARREDVVLATKFEPRTDEEIANGVTGQQHVKNCLDASLKRLGMDYVDLYICHMWDYRTPIEEIMEGLNNAVKAGKVRAIGISNCYAWQLGAGELLRPVCTAWRSLCPFKGIIISFSARRSAKWRRFWQGGEHCDDAIQWHSPQGGSRGVPVRAPSALRKTTTRNLSTTRPPRPTV